MQLQYATVNDLGHVPLASISRCCGLADLIHRLMPNTFSEPIHFIRNNTANEKVMWCVLPNQERGDFSMGYLIGRLSQRVGEDYLTQYGVRNQKFNYAIPPHSEILHLLPHLDKIWKKQPATAIYTLILQSDQDLIKNFAEKIGLSSEYKGHINC